MDISDKIQASPPIEIGHFWLKKNSFILFVICLAILFFQGFPIQTIAQQSKIDSLLKVLEGTKTGFDKVKVFHEISIEYLSVNCDSSFSYSRRGLILAKKINDKKGQENCLNSIGRAYFTIGELDSALSYYKERYLLAIEIADSVGLASGFLNIGNVYRAKGDSKKALDFYLKANKIYASNNETMLLAKACTNIGACYFDNSDYKLASEYYFKALGLYEKSNSDREFLHTIHNIISVYDILKKYDEAINLLDKYKTFTESKNLWSKGMFYSMLAGINSEKKDFKIALNYYSIAYNCFTKVHDVPFQGYMLVGLGRVNMELGNYKKSLQYFLSAIPLLQKSNQQMFILNNLMIANLYLKSTNFAKAAEFLYKSEKLCRNDRNLMSEVSKSFIELYSRLNQPEGVSRYFAIYDQLKDSIFSEQTTKAIAEMQTKYETEKKDKEILTLNMEATKRENTVWFITSGFGILLVISGSGFWVFRNKKKREQAELQQLVAEHDMKALRSQMNPHFIFNCVDSIQRLLSEAKINESKESLMKFSSLTRTVLENSTKREIPLSKEIETIRLYMDLENMRFKKPFIYEIKPDADIDPETTLIPPLILQPFVENAIKHGFRDPLKNGLLKIEVRKENELLVCTVEDNGVGRSESMKIKSLSGFKKESIGMKLTEERLKTISKMKKIKSHFIIDDLVDSYNKPLGTRIKMFLPYELLI